MFDFWGDGLLVKDLTMGNFCNVDLEYPGLKTRASDPPTTSTKPCVPTLKVEDPLEIS
jgi:hypothetical protein